MQIVTAPPKSTQVADAIRERIESGNFKAGDRLLPVRGFAKEYGVSTQVVQSAFDILDRDGLIERRRGCGTFVAAPSRSIAAGTAVVITPNPADTHSRLHTLLPAALQEQGLLSYVLDTRRIGEGHAVEELRLLLASRPRVLILDMLSTFHPDVLSWRHPDTRLIVIKRLEFPRPEEASSVILLDYEAAGHLACRHLLDRGRRRIAMLSFERKPGWTSDLMTRGCEKALAEAGLALNNYLLHTDDVRTMAASMQRHGIPDGLVLSADAMYPMALAALESLGCRAGRDVECVGYGRTPWAEAYRFASVDPREEELAAAILETMATGRRLNRKIVPGLWLPVSPPVQADTAEPA